MKIERNKKITLLLEKCSVHLFGIISILCIIGVTTATIPLGVCFILSLAITLYGIFCLIQKDKLTNFALWLLVACVIILLYTASILFFSFDIKEILNRY